LKELGDSSAGPTSIRPHVLPFDSYLAQRSAERILTQDIRPSVARHERNFVSPKAERR